MKPKLRFNKGETEWKKLPLYKCGDFNPTSELPDVFEYVDLESVIGTELKQHRTEQRETAPSRAQRLARRNDIFFQMVRPYQKNNYLFTSNKDNFVFSTGYAQIRPNIDCNFLFSHLQKDSFINEVLLNCTGSSYPAINATTLSNIFITVPSNLEEQTKIGSFFTGIDAVISKTINEIERLKLVKTASLQAMFPQKGETVPRLRFKGFSDKWIKTTLGEFTIFSKGSGYSKADLKEFGTPIILYGRMYTNYSFTINEINTFADKKRGSIVSKGNEIIIPASGETPEDIAIASHVSQNGIILGGDLNILYTDKNLIDPSFLALAITYTETHKELVSFSQGKSVVHLHSNEIAKAHVRFPDIKEQMKIADFFINLDRQISLAEKKLEKLKKVKQSCLDMMFV